MSLQVKPGWTEPGRAVADPDLIPERIPVIVRGPSRAQLEALGATVGTEAGPILTAEIPVGSIPALMGLMETQRVEAPAAVEPLLDVTASEIGVDGCWGDSNSPYAPPLPGVTGSGVVVGIVDTGIDFTHPDFQRSNGTSRVKYIWDQSGTSSPPPGFTYGREWSESQINAGQCTAKDTDGHGTHIAGVAAGNGAATGNGNPAYRYVGVAPEADLVVVDAIMNSYKVIDGVNYVFQKAAALDKDAVVLVAFGLRAGAHDGSYSLDQALSALTGPGRLVVAAAGNDGGKPLHSSLNLAVGETRTIQFTIPPYTPDGYVQETVSLEGWHDSGAGFQIRLTSPSGITTEWLDPGETTGQLDTADGGIRVDNAVTTSSSGAKQIFVWHYQLTLTSPSPAPGTWKIDAKRLSGTTTGRLDAWIVNWLLPGTSEAPKFTTFVDPSRLVQSPATGNNIISAGAYATKVSWENVNGSTSYYSGSPPLWELASFSSTGPRRDGAYSPDITAPGYGVAAAISANSNISSYYKVEDGRHWVMKGTSVSAALVAGGLAVLLEEEPGLTPAEARQILRDRARPDSYTGAVPNADWGYGKFDLSDAAPSAVALAPSHTDGFSLQPNPSHGTTSFFLSGENADATERTLGIFDAQGRRIFSLTAAPGHSLTWDGRAQDGREALPGVYFAILNDGNREYSRKFVRVR